MISCVVPSPASINSGIWFRRHRESFPSGFYSVFKKSTVYPIEKDIVRSFRAPELRILGRVSVLPVVTKIESNTKVDSRTQTFKNNDTLPSTFEKVIISDQGASSSGARKPRKEENPRRLCTNDVVIRYPLGTESAIKAMLEYNTLVFVVDKRADKTKIKDTFEKMFKVRAKKVNTSIMPDGTKKAFVMLAPDFNALDVAKRIKIL